MRILGIDSSNPQGSAALLENKKVISESIHLNPSTYSDSVLGLIDKVLSEAGVGLGDIDGIAVTTGPGSFTGLRVGVSLVKGFVLSTGKPFRCIDTLEAVASRVDPTPYPVIAILDARKKEVYAAEFTFQEGLLKRRSPDHAVSPKILVATISEPSIFVGTGLDTYGEFLSEQLGSKFIKGSSIKNRSLAASAAFLAGDEFETQKIFDLNKLTIRYIRKSEAEMNFAGKN